MALQLKKNNRPGRNDECPCGSRLKFKICHGDQQKTAVCNRVANEKMAQLIKVEQIKKIIEMQKQECGVCGHTGRSAEGTCRCQFVTDEEYIANFAEEKYNQSKQEQDYVDEELEQNNERENT